MPSDPVVQFLEERTAERFDVVVRETYDLVFKAAYRVLHDDDRAKDVTQEVFSKLWAGELPRCGVRSGLALLRATASLLACSTRRAERVRAAESLISPAGPAPQSQSRYIDRKTAEADNPLLNPSDSAE